MAAITRRTMVAGLAATALPGSASAIGRGVPARLASRLRGALALAGAPGAGLAVVTAGSVRAFGLGLSDRRARTAATGRTVYHAASISKAVTATALMTLVDRNRIALDAPIAPLLDFGVANPRFPRAAITLRQLLQHRSSISDGNYTARFYGAGDPTLPLRSFLARYLSPGGSEFVSDRCYLTVRPGDRWDYSNVGLALAGHLAERVGTPLESLSRTAIFAPLGMTDAGWRIADAPAARLATPYDRTAGDGLKALDQLGYPDWPAGMLRASARDLGRFLACFLRADTAILTPGAISTMFHVDRFDGFTATLDGQALGWRRMPVGGRHLIGHTGSDPGVTAGIYLDLDRRVGAVVLINLTADDRAKQARETIALALLEAAEAGDAT